MKTLKCCPVAIEIAFSIKFVLDGKAQNGTFWNISNLSLCDNPVDLNVKFKAELVVWKTKIYGKCKFQGSWDQLKIKCVSSDNLGQTIVEIFSELCKIDFHMECFTVHSSDLQPKLLQFAFWVAGYLLAFSFKHFREFLEIS